jgi:hypothetical protein
MSVIQGGNLIDRYPHGQPDVFDQTPKDIIKER